MNSNIVNNNILTFRKPDDPRSAVPYCYIPVGNVPASYEIKSKEPAPFHHIDIGLLRFNKESDSPSIVVPPVNAILSTFSLAMNSAVWKAV